MTVEPYICPACDEEYCTCDDDDDLLGVYRTRQQLADDLPPDSRDRAVIVRGLG